MKAIYHVLAIAMLMACSGCSKAGMSDARRDHILAGDHGWIDITVRAPVQAAGYDAQKACMLAFSVNGETLIEEHAQLSRADENKMPIGYRIAAPAGALQTELAFSHCIKDGSTIKFPLKLEKDQLATVLFDGKELKLKSSDPYEPATLDWVRGELNKMRISGHGSDKTLEMLTMLALGSIGLNIMTMLFILFLRRGRKNPGN
jgi:hypothetical protein